MTAISSTSWRQRAAGERPISSLAGRMIRVCEIDDIPPGEARQVTVAGRAVAVFRAEHGWFALDAICPHKGGPLADGIVSERSVICPLHERRFDLTTGEELTGEHCVGTYEVQVHGRDVYLAQRAAGHSDPA